MTKQPNLILVSNLQFEIVEYMMREKKLLFILNILQKHY